MVKPTPLSRALVAAVVIGALGTAALLTRGSWMRDEARTSRPPAAPSPPDERDAGRPATQPVSIKPGCASLPEVRFYQRAWNAQSGLMLATGGKQSVEDSLMCKHGVNLKLVREDNVDTMQTLMLAFGEKLKAGETNPTEGAHFVAIAGDGSAAFFKGLNDRLRELGPEYTAAVVGSAGASRGEDRFMGPPAWKADPEKARGGLVSGYLRDSDWNIALKWLGDNAIPNNPDDTVYDPDALNWHAASDYIDAARNYVSGYCTELESVKTGEKEKHCVEGVVTWTPGDATVAEEKGGLVSIASTREYRWQMPQLVIGNRKWMAANRPIVEGMLQAIFEAGDQIKESPEALRRAAEISAVVYGERDADYWQGIFPVKTVKDRAGLDVEIGGSAVYNLADNLVLFGLAPGSTNAFAATYSVFGDLLRSQYPGLLPGFYPVQDVLDTSYLQALGGAPEAAASAPDLPSFAEGGATGEVVSRRSLSIQFAARRATFTGSAARQLAALLDDLVIAGGTRVEIHAHTDNRGGADRNQALSEARAAAVKAWLEKQSPTSFPPGRIQAFGHGQTQPLVPNTSKQARARNQRVEIVLRSEP